MVQIRVDLCPIDQIRRSSCIGGERRDHNCTSTVLGIALQYVLQGPYTRVSPEPFRSKRCNYRDITVKTLDPRQNIMNIRLLSRRRVCRGHNRAVFDKERGYFAGGISQIFRE